MSTALAPPAAPPATVKVLKHGLVDRWGIPRSVGDIVQADAETAAVWFKEGVAQPTPAECWLATSYVAGRLLGNVLVTRATPVKVAYVEAAHRVASDPGHWQILDDEQRATWNPELLPADDTVIGDKYRDPELDGVPTIEVIPLLSGIVGNGRSGVIVEKDKPIAISEVWAVRNYFFGRVRFDPEGLSSRGKAFLEAWTKWDELHGGKVMSNMAGEPTF
jgi:hypothetical protein